MGKIIEKFTKHIEILNTLKIRSMNEGYLCPICLRNEKEIKATGHGWTAEHNPPESVGGRVTVVTCEDCNSKSGSDIDVHLINRLTSKDERKLFPDSHIKGKAKIDDKIFNSSLYVDSSGELAIEPLKGNNNPKLVEETWSDLEYNKPIVFDFQKRKSDNRVVEIALLKIAYLMAFEKYGYIFILDSCYDSIRDQLINPDKKIYHNFKYYEVPFPEEHNGVYIIKDKGLESILSIFTLQTSNRKRSIQVVLPLPMSPIGRVVKELNNRIKRYGTLRVDLFPHPEENFNFLLNQEHIYKIKEMLTSINNTKI